MIKRFCAAVSLLVASGLSSAMLLDGNNIPEQQQVHGQDLQLNGAGARSAMGTKIYLAALYLPNKSQDADTAINAASSKRMLLQFKRNVRATVVVASLRDGIKQNASDSELNVLQPALQQMESALSDIYETRSGDRLALDFAKDGSVALFYNDTPAGNLSGPSIGPAMLKIWLGKKPANDELKNALLAGASYAKTGSRVSAFDSIFDGYSP